MVGWVGFGGQIVAVALAPLTLVQAFSAGSLALSVPLAARVFGHRVRAPQLAAIAIIAVSLISLPIGYGAAHGQFHAGPLIASALLVVLAGAMLAPRGGTVALAIAAGAFYGAADAAIKAASIGIRFHGASVLSGWTLLGRAVHPWRVLRFPGGATRRRRGAAADADERVHRAGRGRAGDRGFRGVAGINAGRGVLHGLAILLVLMCVRPLAGAQQRLVEGAPLPDSTPAPRSWPRLQWPARLDPAKALSVLRPKTILLVVGGSVLGAAAILACSAAVLGLLSRCVSLAGLPSGLPCQTRCRSCNSPALTRNRWLAWWSPRSSWDSRLEWP